MTEASLIAFLWIAAIVIVTPGPDTALTIRNTLTGGRAGGLATAAGIVTGLAMWAMATSAGLAAVIIASEPLFVAIRLVGAAYLLYLGARTLIGVVRGRGQEPVKGVGTPVRGLATPFRQGLICNLSNPKIALFFTSLLPQFVPANDAAFGSLLGLGAIFCAMGLVWLSLYAVVVARAGNIFRRPSVRRAMNAILGVALVGLGLRVATSAR
jgi:threonine/homoserine/homoserine lactone efflux protein